LQIACAGALLPLRPRNFISAVLESVMAAVPKRPATNPLPTASAKVVMAAFFMIRLPLL
jgi:hypothetical protein